MSSSKRVIGYADLPACEVRDKRRRQNGNAVVGILVGLAIALLLASVAPVQAQTVIGSLHDLSTTSGFSDQVCAFCHTPHTANTDVVAPLWNRFVDLSATFTVYQSSTMDTVPGQPTLTISGVCLGCHDGTISMVVVNGIVGSTKHDLVNAPGPGGTPDTTSWPNCRRCHGEIYGDPPARWQGTDLTDDHPISMTYPTPAEDPAFQTPPDLIRGWSDVYLYEGMVECPSCHDVHDPTLRPFLRKSNAASQLCLTCHIK